MAAGALLLALMAVASDAQSGLSARAFTIVDRGPSGAYAASPGFTSVPGTWVSPVVHRLAEGRYRVLFIDHTGAIGNHDEQWMAHASPVGGAHVVSILGVSMYKATEVFDTYHIEVLVEVYEPRLVQSGEFILPDYTDGAFALYLYRDAGVDPGEPGAYVAVDADGFTGMLQIPPPRAQWNSLEDHLPTPNLVLRAARGQYIVLFKSLQDPFLHRLKVIATTVGSDSTRATVADVRPVNGDAFFHFVGTAVCVECVNIEGELTDSSFFCSLVGDPSPGLDPDNPRGAHVRVGALPPLGLGSPLTITSLSPPGGPLEPPVFPGNQWIGAAFLFPPPLALRLFGEVNGLTFDQNNGITAARLLPGVYDVCFDEMPGFSSVIALACSSGTGSYASIASISFTGPERACVQYRVRDKDMNLVDDEQLNCFYFSDDYVLR